MNTVFRRAYMKLKKAVITGVCLTITARRFTRHRNGGQKYEKTFEESGIDFYATVTNVENGKSEYKKIDSVFEQKNTLYRLSCPHKVFAHDPIILQFST